ncbi:low molecular weight phosphotyrosine protein phosphatase [Microbacterium sp. JB110]|nr:low molecular weight protein-tyrosine-phosphatase [Microbacterium sp. JB110]RCS62093.1 low molecular weight phosphotyrosine protein phosphatase [Microbacterium sp. JB110]SJM65190.1 Low molecular weight protein tyrosine phosphatase [Frigoribacterium sp. JB110]
MLVSISKVIVVCTGNICRSPMGEVVLRERLAEGEIDADVVSSGISSEELGNPIDPRAAEALAARGYEVPRRTARWVGDTDDVSGDLILAMTRQHRDALIRRGADPARTRLWMEFVPGADDADVSDPWFGDRDGFEETLDLIEAAAPQIVDTIRASRT